MIDRMIDRKGLSEIMNFVANRWIEVSKDPENKVMKTLPNNFWMNSVGGKAGQGRWVTMLMYTENEADANGLREVLLRWQIKGMESKQSPDLIQIGKK